MDTIRSILDEMIEMLEPSYTLSDGEVRAYEGRVLDLCYLKGFCRDCASYDPRGVQGDMAMINGKCGGYSPNGMVGCSAFKHKHKDPENDS